MSLFPTDGFVPLASHYPNLFIIEEEWRQHPDYHLGVDSVDVAHSGPAIPRNATNYHAEMTLAVIQAIAPGIPAANICRVSFGRQRVIEIAEASNLFNKSLPEALLSLDFSLIKKGDVLTINVQSLGDQAPIADDVLISRQLSSLLKYPGCLPIVAAGNSGVEVPNSPAYECLIVGGLRQTPTGPIEKSSNYGPGVSCYFLVPVTVSLNNQDQLFGNSSAATAAMSGVAMLVQNYCQFKGYVPTSKDLIDILRQHGRRVQFSVDSQSFTGVLPEWTALRAALDAKYAVAR